MGDKSFRVKLKRVTYAEVIIRAETATAARQQVEAEGPHEWFVTSENIGIDTTSIVSVQRDQNE